MFGIGFTPLADIRFVETHHAVRSPSGRPFTDDMRNMIEKLDTMGQVNHHIPAMYESDGVVYVHPAMSAKVKLATRKIAERLDKMFENTLLGQFY